MSGTPSKEELAMSSTSSRALADVIAAPSCLAMVALSSSAILEPGQMMRETTPFRIPSKARLLIVPVYLERPGGGGGGGEREREVS